MAVAVSSELSSPEENIAVVGGGVHEAENKAATAAATDSTGSESAIMETPKRRRRERFRWRRSGKKTSGDQANTAIAAPVMENDVVAVVGGGADQFKNETPVVAAADFTGKLKKKKNNREAMGTPTDVVAIVGGSGDEVKKNTGMAAATESSRKISKINRSQKSFPCKFSDICDREFPSRKELNKHEKNEHSNVKNGKHGLTENNDMKDGPKKHKHHIKKDKRTKLGAEKKFPCPYPSCSRCFRTEKDVNKHQKLH